MYDQYFDEADEYTSEEVLERAYALGVESVCGDRDDEAYRGEEIRVGETVMDE